MIYTTAERATFYFKVTYEGDWVSFPSDGHDGWDMVLKTNTTALRLIMQKREERAKLGPTRAESESKGHDQTEKLLQRGSDG